MKYIYITLIMLCFSLKNIAQQSTIWPVPFYFPEYQVYLKITNNVNLYDTCKIIYSEKIFFKFVFFDKLGKSYCEVYKNERLYEKGYYENSLDTLKKYSTPVRTSNRPSMIKVLLYFQPIKNGEWFETKRGKVIKKKYKMGIDD